MLMPEERANELLGEVIDYISTGRNCYETIKELIKIGFKPEELFNYFGFNLLDISDSIEDMEEYDNE